MVSHDVRRVLPALAGGGRARQGGAVGPGRRRGVRRLPLVPAAWPTRRGDGSATYAGRVLRPRPRGRWPSSSSPTGWPTTTPTAALRRRALRPAGRRRPPSTAALRIDTEVMLVEDPVKRVDNMTMAWGLEARVPFLDHELVELAGALPARAEAGPGRQGRAQGDRPAGDPRRGDRPPQGLLPGAGPHPPRGRGPRPGPRRARRRRAAKDRGPVPHRARSTRCSPTRTARSPRWAATSCGRSACSSCGCRRHVDSMTTTRRAAAPPARRRRHHADAASGARWPARADVARRLRLGAAASSARPSPTTTCSPPRCATEERGRARHLPLPARPARAGRPAPRRAVHRPVAHLPARPRRPRARRADRAATSTIRDLDPATRPTPTPVNDIYARYGMVAAPADDRPRERRTAGVPLPGRRRPAPGAIVGTVTGIDHVEAFGDPEGGSSLWCLAVDPHAAPPGAGEALVRGAGRRLRRARPRLPRPVGAPRQRAAPSPSTRSSASTHAAALRQAQEPHQRAAVRAAGRRGRGAQPLRPDHRRRGDAARHPRRGDRRRGRLAAADPRRPLDRHPRVAVGADHRGRHEPLRRQAGHPPDPDRRRAAGAARPGGHRRPRGPRACSRPWAAWWSSPPAASRAGASPSAVNDPRRSGAADRPGPRVLPRGAARGVRARRRPARGGDRRRGGRRRGAPAGGGRRRRHAHRRRADRAPEPPARRRDRRRVHHRPRRRHREPSWPPPGYAMDDVPPGRGRAARCGGRPTCTPAAPSHDVTATVHPELVDVAGASGRGPRHPGDGHGPHRRRTSRQPDYVFIEANERPGLANHEPQPTVERFVDLLFPGTVGVPRGWHPEPIVRGLHDRRRRMTTSR